MHWRDNERGNVTDQQRDALPDDAFAYVDNEGERHLLIHDETDVCNPIDGWDQTHFKTGPSESARERNLEVARWFNIAIDEDSSINQ